MSVTLEAAGEQLTAEEHMHTAEWGEQPTRRFFKVAQAAAQSAGIRRLYKYVPGSTPGTGAESTEILTDPAEIAYTESASKPSPCVEAVARSAP
jgi:hypothetical protein